MNVFPVISFGAALERATIKKICGCPTLQVLLLIRVVHKVLQWFGDRWGLFKRNVARHGHVFFKRDLHAAELPLKC